MVMPFWGYLTSMSHSNKGNHLRVNWMISCGSTSWVGRIRWQWKYGQHCAIIDILLFFSIPARLLFSLCSPLAPFSAHLNAWNKPVLTMKILHWLIEDDKKGLQIILGQRYSINRISRFFPFLGCLCCTDQYAWYMAARAVVLSSRSVWCHSNHVKAHARDATIITLTILVERLLLHFDVFYTDLLILV